ncbi:MAG: glycosyltransferase [Ignavibacteria bacterium]|nr:glycosyltransferase [Ignavibacteria bacterium]
MKKIELSIIYVYYYSSPYIEESIRSVLKKVTNIEFEIIVVVNGGDIDYINNIPKISNNIRIIFNKNNSGFGSANNIGFGYSKGNHILILNPDTYFEQLEIDNLIYRISQDKQYGIAICKLLTKDNKVQRNNIYKRYNILIIILELFFLFRLPLIKNLFYLKSDFEKEQNPVVISGAFMLFKREIYENLKGFDEKFFMYGEDKDICLRASKITKIFYSPLDTVIHIGDSSLGNEASMGKLQMMYSSQIKNVEKNFGTFAKSILYLSYFSNALLFLPLSYLININEYKILLHNRSIVFFKLIFNYKKNI